MLMCQLEKQKTTGSQTNSAPRLCTKARYSFCSRCTHYCQNAKPGGRSGAKQGAR